MKFKGGLNFYSAFFNNNFLMKNCKVYSLHKNFFAIKYFYLLFLFLSFSIYSFSSINLPKAALKKSNAAIPYFSGHVNITVSGTSTSGGGWSGTGTINDPRIFTPNGTTTANISPTDLASVISTYAYVQITTATTGAGNSAGTFIIQSPVSSTSALSGTNRKFSIIANSTITVSASSNITLTTSSVSGNENYNSADIEFISSTGNISIGSTISTTPSNSFSTSLLTYVAGGNISLTCSASTGTISIISGGSLNTVGGRNSNNEPTSSTAPGRGGDISLTGLAGITISGNINASSGSNGNGLKLNGVAGALTVNTNAASTSGGVNDGQSTSSTLFIGAFTKEGTGNFVVKKFEWGGYPDLGTSYNNPNYTINNGTVTIAATNAFDQKAQVIINNTGTLNLGTFSLTVGSLAGTVNGTLTGGSGSLLTMQYPTVDPAYIRTTFDGQITGSIGLYKTFPSSFTATLVQHGALTLTNANTYTGITTIDRGSIIITNNSALGATSGNTIVKYGLAGMGLSDVAARFIDGGTLQLMGGITIAEPMTIKGIGDNNFMNNNNSSVPSNLGAIYDSTGNNSLTGIITLDSAATIGTLISTTSSPSNTLSLTNINLNGKVLTIDNNKVAVNISSVAMTGLGGLTKTGTDTLILSIANTYTGITKISKGTLKLGIANAISNSSDIYFDGGNLSTGGFSDVFGNAYVTNSGSTLTLSSSSHSIIFNNSDNSFVTNYLLIKGSSGNFAGGSAGSGGKIQFTNSQTNLQLDRFLFYNNNGKEHYATQLNTTPFEIVPGNDKSTSFTGYANINISNLSSTPGSWGGSGTLASPFVFTPSPATDNININFADIQNRIVLSDGYVTINTDYTNGTKAGAIFINNAITASNATSTKRVLTFSAKKYIYVNQSITLSSSSTSGSVVPEINISSDSIYINAAVTANGTNTSTSASKAANGGAITLNSAAGIVKIATTGSLESKGTNNTNTSVGSLGGDGGVVSILGQNGLTILGNINTSNGYSNGNTATLNLSRPGTLIVSTTNSTTTTGGGVNDGQTTGVLTIGNLVKNGTGTFPITKSVWGGSAGIGTTSYTSPIDSVNAGTLRLLSTNALSDSAHVQVVAGATFDLNNNAEIIGMIEGAGTITSASGTPELKLSGIFTDSLASTFSGSLASIALTTNASSIDTLTLSGNNTSFTGVTTISGGLLKITNANALGTAVNTTIVNSGGTLQIVGNNITFSKPLTINGTGLNSAGAIRNTSGINYFTGAITVASASTIVSTGSSALEDSLVFKDGVMTLSNTLTVNTVRGVRLGNNISNQITSTGGITKTGTDTLVMLGNNNYTGITTVSAGAISIRNANALGAGANNTVVSNGAALYVVGTGFSIPETIQIDGTGIGMNGAIWIPSTTGATTFTGAITTNTVAASRINNDGSGLLTISNAAFTNNGGITFGLNGTGGTTVSSAIGGNGALTKDGTGTGMLILSGASTYAGLTTISTGVVQATNASALGNTTGATTITAGAALEINGAINIGEAMTINGTGIAATPGVIRLISGSGAATLSGAITVATASRINSDAATNALTIGTGAITNTGGLTFGTSNTGNISVTSAISGVGAITKDGIGTGRLILGGTNLYTGLTTVSTGVIQLTNKDGLGSSPAGTGSSNTIVSDGAALEINVASTTIVPETLNIYGLGFVETTPNGAIRMISGSAATISGPINILSASRINNTAGGVLTFQTGAFTNTNGVTFGITSTGGITVSSVISGAGSITKDGTASGRLILGGVNTYEGATNITQGFLQITSSDGLGSQTAGTLGYSSTTISDGAALELNGTAAITVPEVINVNGNGVTGTPGAIRQIHASNSATLNGAITALTGTATSINNDANGLLTIGTGGITNTGGVIFRTTGTTGGINVTGVISGVGALTKDGALTGTGRLVLSAANTYEGITTVTNGVLQVKNNDALGSASAGTGTSYTTVSSPAAIEFNGASALTIPEDIRINGTGFSESSVVNGALRQLSGAFATTLTGGLTSSTAARIENDATTAINISTTPITNSAALTLLISTTGDINITSVITGNGGITKDGTGTGSLILNADNGTTYTGVTTVSAGLVKVIHNNALGATSGITNVTGGTLILDSAGYTFNEPFSLSGNGVIRNLGLKTILAGQIDLAGSGTLSSQGSANVGYTADSLVVTGNINTGNAGSYIVTLEATKGIRISGVISGSSGGITKTGTDTLILNNANTYAGATSINAGVVIIYNNDALGSATAGTGSSSTTIASGAAIKLLMDGLIIPESIIINGTGINSTGAIRNSIGANNITGLVTISTASRINIDVSTTLTISTGGVTNSGGLNVGGLGNLAITGIVTGSGVIVKDGISNTSTLTLAGNNSAYNGAITVNANAGILNVQNSNALGTLGVTLYPNGAGGTFSYASGATAQQIALAACESVNGVGNCSIGGCGYFAYYYKTGELSCDCNKPVNTYEFIYSNTGYTTVGNDYGGQSTNITSAVPFTRRKASSTCDANSWVLAQANLGSVASGNTANTTINSGSVLQIQGSNLIIPENIIINGTGINNDGAIRNLSGFGSNTLSGTILVNATGSRINSDANTLTLSNATAAINTSTSNALSIGGLGAVTVTGLLTGGGTITKDGTGSSSILTLKGNSTGFTGSVVVAANSNILKVSPTATSNTSVLGTTAGSTTINAGSTMQIEGGVTLLAKPITIFGTGINNDGVIRNLSGANIITGAVTASSNTRINADAGSLTFNTAGTGIALGSNLINFGVATGTTMTVSNIISGAAASTSLTVTKDGVGALVLGGVNTYTGITTISAGVIQATNGAALGSTTGATIVESGAALEINGTITIAEAITINGTGLAATPGAIRMISGSGAATLSGLITVATASRINSDAATNALTIGTGGVTNTGGLSFGISTSGNIVVSSVVSGVEGIIKDGTGTGKLVLSGANTYQGTTLVNAGILQATVNDALGSQTAGTLGYSSTTVSSGASLEINGTISSLPENIFINGTGISSGGAIRMISTSGASTIAGVITTQTASRINNDATTNAFTISTGGVVNTGGVTFGIGSTGPINITGVISNAGSVTKDLTGTGRLVLSAANTYEGITTVTNGVLQVKNNDALGSASAGTGTSYTTVSSPAAIEFNGASALTIPEDIRINGTGFSESSVVNGALRQLSGAFATTLTGGLTSSTAARIENDATTAINISTTPITNSAALTLLISTTGDINITTTISGIGGIIKEGSGTGNLVLSADNSAVYTGVTTVSAGVLKISNEKALGSSVTGNTVINGGTVLIDGTGFNVAEPFTISGTGYTSLGAIRNPSGSNTLSGAISLNNTASATIISASTGADLFELSGAINTGTSGSYVLTFDGTGNIKSSGPISGAGGITKLGLSTLTITGSNTSYTGATIIGGAILNGGIVNIQHNNALGTVAAGQGTTVYNGSSLQFQGGLTAIAAEPINIRGNGYNNTLGVINNFSGLNVFAGPITLDSAARIVSSGTSTDSLRLTGTIALQDKQLTIQADEGINITNTISSTGSPVNSLIKTGAGYLTLEGTSNSYIGATTVTAGVLNLGAAGVVPDNSLLYMNGGTLSTNYAETIKKLYLTNASAINLGSSAHTIIFTSVDALVNNTQLTINGWQGSYTTGVTSGGGKIVFSNDTLFNYQLDQVRFADESGTTYYSEQVLASKEIIPKPSAGSIALNNTNNSNITITSSGSSDGSWTTSGSTDIFTPNKDGANLLLSDLTTRLTTAGKSVKVQTNRSGGTQSGTIIVDASITAISSNTNSNTLSLYGSSNVVIYKDIVLQTGNAAYPVTNIDFNSELNDIIIQAALKTNGLTTQNSATIAAGNGGNVTLTANGKVRIYANGSIETKGGSNIGTGNGGNGGSVILSGKNGVSIFGNINTTNGTKSTTNYANTSRPGSLTIYTEKLVPDVFDGQLAGIMMVGDIYKKGRGRFDIKSSAWAWPAAGNNDILYKAADTIFAGTLKLLSGTALSDSANIVIMDTANATLDLNAQTEAIGSIAGGGIITGTGGSLTLTSVTTKNSAPINTVFSGVLSGTFGLTKSVSGQTAGVDTLVLSNDNSSTYNGTITVNYGVLKVSNEKALGSVTANTVINGNASNGGTVLIDSAGYTITEPFNITGTGFVANYGAIRNLGKQTILAGAITLGGSATIVSFGSNTVTSSDSLVITGGINAGASGNYILTTQTNRGMRIANIISGATGGLTKTGTDTLILNSANTYAGSTLINTGTVLISNKDALGSATAGTGSSSTTVGVSGVSGATLRIIDANGGTPSLIVPEAITLNGTGAVAGAGSIRNLNGLNVFQGTITLGSDATIVSSGTSTDSLRLTGTIALQDKQLTIQADEGINITNTISSTGSPVNSLIKTGAGYLTLEGTSNSYIGATTVTAGVLNLGAAGVVPDNSLLYMNGGTLSTNYAETIKKLYLTNASAINLGSSAHTIIFTSVDALVNNTQLTINGWQGSYTTGVTSGGGKIVFSNDTLFNYQLDQVRFADESGTTYYSEQVLASKEIIPKPSAGSIALNNTNNSNITITSSGSSDGSWTTSGSTDIFTPNKDGANLLLSDLTTRLTTAGKSVKVQTNRSGGTQSGTIIVDASITAISSNTNSNTLSLYGSSNVVIYKDIVLQTGNAAYPVTNIDFNSELNDIIIQAALKTNGLTTQNSATIAAGNGGNVTLTANGKVRIYANGSIETKGGSNIGTGNGGNGGSVILSGKNGVSIFGNINTTNGTKSTTNYANTSRPGSLTIYTEKLVPDVFDGQLAGIMMVGDIYKKGRGRFDIKSSAWAWPAAGNNDILYKAADTIFAGTLKLLSGTALSDSANIVIMDTANATLDLNAQTEAIGSIAGGGIITGTGGSLTLTSVTTKNSAPINTVFSGVLSGTFGLTKSVSGQTAGVDTLVLSNDNSSTYNGTITVNYGVLKVSNEKALGSVTANTVINGNASNGGTVLIDSAGYTITEPFNITGTGFVANYGAIRNLGKQTILAGAITLGGSATIVSFGSNTVTSSDSLVITGGITLGSNALTLNTVRGMRIGEQGVASSKITGLGSVIKNTGTDTLVMNSSNDYSGTTTLTTGVVVLKTVTGLGNGTGTSDNTSIASGAAVRLEISGATISEHFSINGTGAVTGTGAIRVPSTSAGNTLSGTITIASANSRINSDATLLTLNNATSMTVTNAVTIGGLGEVLISGALSGAGAITKDGVGAGSILTLKGNSTLFSGAITVNANSNILKVSPTVNTNTSVLGTTGMITINSGSAMTIEGGVALVSKPITIFGTGINNDGVIRNISGANTITGAITVSSAARINNDDASNALTISTGAYTNSFTSTIGGNGSVNISSVISGAGALVKDGGTATTLTLSGASSSYTGNISVGTIGTPAAGILRVITSSSALGTNGGTTTIYDGSALHIGDGTAITLADNITVYGTGIGGAGVIRNILGVNILSGLTTLASASRINSDAGTLTFNNGTKAIELVSYALNIGGTAGDVVLSGPINGSGDITKDGGISTTLTLSANNNSGSGIYTGNINIGTVGTPAAGILKVITNNNALGTTAGTTTIYNGSSLNIGDATAITVPENITINGLGVSGAGGVIRNITGTHALSGLVTLASASRINSDAGTLTFSNVTKAIEFSTYALNIGGAAGNVVLSGPINGSGDITKDGGTTTTLTLSGNNNSGSGIYTGNINVGTVSTTAAGILRVVTSNYALGTTDGKTTIYSGSALNIGDGVTAITVPENLDIYGSGISAGGAIRNISGTNTLTGDISLLAASRINSDLNNLIINNVTEAISMGSFALNIGGTATGAVTVSGVITGSGGTLTKDGLAANFLYLSGNNTYTGITAISSGVINVQSASALGDVSGNTTISAGAALQIQGGISLAAEPISLSSTGISTDGGIRNISGNNIITGTVTSAAASRINSDLDTLILNNNAGALVLNATTTFGGVNNTFITGKIAGSNALFGITKDGIGTLILSGTANDYLGITSVTSGFVKVNNVNSLGATSGNTVVNGGTVLLDSAGGYSISEPFSITGTGYTSLGTIRNLGKISTLNGVITLAGSASIASSGNHFTTSNDSLLITGPIDLGSAGTATNFILTTVVDRGMNISGIISGNTGGLTKTGSDTLLITGTGANTYKGASVLSNGKIKIKKVSALGTADLGTTINDGTTLLVDMNGFSLTEPLSIIGNGVLSGANYEGAVKTLYGKNSITGTVTLIGNSNINIGAVYQVGNSSDSLNLSSISTGSSSAYELTLTSNVGTKVNGVISGNGSIIKEGLDTLVLSAVNTYKGATKLNKGCIRLGANYVLPSSSTNSFIFNGGTFSSGGFSDTLGILSITENSALDIRYTPIHELRFSEKANFVAGKKLTIYGWSGLVAETITKFGQSKGGDSTFVLKTLLKRTGETSTSKTNTMTKYGQEISAAIFTNYRGKLFFTSATPFAATLLNQYELNRIIFHNDFSDIDYSASQNADTRELVAGDIYVTPTETQVAPTISQTTVSAITSSGATVGGTISATGGVTINSSGVVWSTIPLPSIFLSTNTTNGRTTVGTYTGTASSLSVATLYYARAYATYTMGTKTGTTYGPEITFTTLAAPTGTQLDPISDLTQTLAAGTYYFAPPGATDATIQLYYEPNLRGTGFNFVRVFSSPTAIPGSGTLKTATVNHIGKNLPITQLMVNNVGSASNWATAGWSSGGYRRFNTLGANSDYPTTGTKSGTGFRVFFGNGGGHGIYNSSQNPCSWSNSTGSIGAGYYNDCGNFPDRLLWGTGNSSYNYDNIVTDSVWEIWIRW